MDTLEATEYGYGVLVRPRSLAVADAKPGIPTNLIAEIYKSFVKLMLI